MSLEDFRPEDINDSYCSDSDTIYIIVAFLKQANNTLQKFKR